MSKYLIDVIVQISIFFLLFSGLVWSTSILPVFIMVASLSVNVVIRTLQSKKSAQDIRSETTTNQTKDIASGEEYSIPAKRAFTQGITCIGGVLFLHLLEKLTMGGRGFGPLLFVTIPLIYIGLVRITFAALWTVLKKKVSALFIYVPIIVTLLYVLLVINNYLSDFLWWMFKH